MPCYQTQTASCTLENADHDLLEQALAEEGYETARNTKANTLNFVKKDNRQVTGTYSGEKLTVRGPQGVKIDTDAIKRKYSEKVVRAKAKKHGFKVEAKPGNKFILTKIANRM